MSAIIISYGMKYFRIFSGKVYCLSHAMPQKDIKIQYLNT